ncbi:MAG TPA: alpha/beta hydrolase [Candidatus Saccharimonadales bacterium]|nr:alpha/beta hydrolase [Candidatus Saccharimonadales bacterium]
MINKEIIVNGLKASYLISSDFNPNQAIVFLPGWKSPVSLFCSVMGDTHNLVALNLPGWGGSENPKSVWGLAEYADFVKEFLNKIDVKNPIIIGHSVGGAIATEYIANGGQATKLIIIGGALIRERLGRSRRLFIVAKIFRFLFPFINKHQRQKLFGKSLSPDYVQAGELEEIYQRLIGEDRQSAFSELKLPIILIWGQNDQATPYLQAERLKKLNSQVILETILGAGHYSFLDKPEEFKKIIAKYL